MVFARPSVSLTAHWRQEQSNRLSGNPRVPYSLQDPGEGSDQVPAAPSSCTRNGTDWSLPAEDLGSLGLLLCLLLYCRGLDSCFHECLDCVLPLVTGFLWCLLLHLRHVVMLCKPGCWAMSSMWQPSSPGHPQQCVCSRSSRAMQGAGLPTASPSVLLTTVRVKLDCVASWSGSWRGRHWGTVNVCAYLPSSLLTALARHRPVSCPTPNWPTTLSSLPWTPSGPVLLTIIPCLLLCFCVNLQPFHMWDRQY